MIENRELEIGTKLTARFKKQVYTAEVVEADRDDVAGSKDEGLRIRLEDGRVFRSVSSAAAAITGGAINGWRFWSLAPAESAATEPQPEAPADTAAPEDQAEDTDAGAAKAPAERKKPRRTASAMKGKQKKTR